MSDRFVAVAVMGVAGSGKTTVGRALANAMGWCFHDGDSLHPASNIAKMSRGEPLTDQDRAPWIASIAELVDRHRRSGRSVVIAYSALKKAYRTALTNHASDVTFVYLRGAPQLLEERLRNRNGHFMGPEMLASQLADLEEPTDAIIVDVSRTVDAIVTGLIGRCDTAG
jgi:gluconokinase